MKIYLEEHVFNGNLESIKFLISLENKYGIIDIHEYI